MPLVMANAKTVPDRARAAGGSSAGACMHTILAKCPLLKPSASTSAAGQPVDLRACSGRLRLFLVLSASPWAANAANTPPA